jgi:hypothetical protein
LNSQGTEFKPQNHKKKKRKKKSSCLKSTKNQREENRLEFGASATEANSKSQTSMKALFGTRTYCDSTQVKDQIKPNGLNMASINTGNQGKGKSRLENPSEDFQVSYQQTELSRTKNMKGPLAF